jgi:hypothetical protein
MPAENEIAATAELAPRGVVSPWVSPWQAPLRASVARRWQAWLAGAWREGMALYVRAAMARGQWNGERL